MISKRILFAKTLARLGHRDLRLVARHRVRLRNGYYARKFPVADWRMEDVEFVSPFVVPVLRDVPPLEPAVNYFSWDRRPLPEDWHTHPLTAHRYPTTHWSRISMFAGGDIKWMWEPSRMDWVIAACRALASGQKAPDLMPEIRRWRDANRPNEGVNWACGQETSFRMFALMIAATVLKHKDREGAREVRAMLSQHAERIESALPYAVAQHNNHGLSETVALFLAGHALPKHPRADIWRQEGKSWFSRQVLEQFSHDGWYCQHSHNYTRVALLNGLIGLRVGQFFGDYLSPGVTSCLKNAALLLAGLCRDGKTPNYGSNDGANVLPLHGCGYEDFRPVIAAVLRACGEPSPFEPGPWDELSLWFGLSLGEKQETEPRSSKEGGYYVLADHDWLAAIRCHTYADRPAHADMLHVDLWDGPNPVLIDAGTYSYNDPDGIGDFLKSTGAHNAVTVDGADQMVKGTRFLWLDWTESRVIGTPTKTEFTGEHYGYRTRQGVIHRRSVELGEVVTITDELFAVDRHRYAVIFRLGGEDWTLEEKAVSNGLYRISFEGAKPSLGTPGEDTLTNARSEYYGKLQRGYAAVLELTGESTVLKVRIERLA
jgi:hypothetical protein